MDFFNEVESEVVRVLPNGVSIKVKAKASASSNESYEDAWLKAQEKAKADAEKKMIEVMAKLEKGDSNITEVVITGPQGSPGFPGNRGPRGTAGSDGKDLKNLTKSLTTPLKLTKEAREVLKRLLAIDSKQTFAPKTSDLTFGSLENLIVFLLNVYKDFFLVGYSAFDGDFLTLKSDENLVDDNSSELSSFFTDNELALTQGINFNAIQILKDCSNSSSECTYSIGILGEIYKFIDDGT